MSDASSTVQSIARAPTGREIFVDKAFRCLSFASAVLTVLLVLVIVLEIGGAAYPSIQKLGLGYITSSTWDANQEQYEWRPHFSESESDPMKFCLRQYLVLGLVVLTCTAAGCGGSTGGSTASGARLKLQGAGASFPAPIYHKWFKAYTATHSNVQIDYQSVGSGSGVKAVIDKTVDFEASDAAMSEAEIKQVDAGVQLLPMTAGSIVLAYNVPGVDKLQLPRAAYVGIFLGKVTKWNDPAIAAANASVKLPDSPIHVVVRADSSGTTFVFTKHLAAISEEFAGSPGVNKMPNWPTGTKSKGNEGVAGSIHTTPGAIGYMEFGYAVGAKLKMATLENKGGKFVEPTIASARPSLESVDMPDDLVAWLPDPDGDGSYPIVTYTWVMAYKQYADAGKAQALKDVLTFCLGDGQSHSEALGYVPLPSSVTAKVVKALENIQTAK
jgi:phosphate transport system substrate-binding protein